MPVETKWSAFATATAIQTADAIVGLQSGANVKYPSFFTVQAASPFNVGFGYQVFNATPTGTFNTSFGYQSSKALTTGSSNATFGGHAGQNFTSAGSNTAIGTFALSRDDTGSGNTMVGYFAGGCLTATFGHMNNTGVGINALGQATDSASAQVNNNCAFGISSIGNITQGNQNCGYGSTSLTAVTTGSDNTGLGYNAGSTLTTGSQNTLVGSGANVSSGAAANRIGIGYSVTVSNNNYAVIGNSSVTNMINASTTGGCLIGDATHPYGALYIGTSNVSIAKIVAASQAAARIYTVPDAGADTTFVMSGAALGTPSSGTLTNCSSLPIGATFSTGLNGGTVTTSTPLMAGFAVTQAVKGTHALINICGQVSPGASGNPQVGIRYGTGTAPVLGAAVTGTLGGTIIAIDNSSNTVGFSRTAIITGLTPGTTYWFDMQLAQAAGSNAAQLQNVDVSVLSF